jgi:acyl-CoA reductase-like NAD-dependent aldehyde dehydrogenase
MTSSARDFDDPQHAASPATRRPWLPVIDGVPLARATLARMSIRNPARDEVVASVPVCDEHVVDLAARSSRTAYRQWRQLPLEARLAMIDRCRRAVLDATEELARLDAETCGNPIRFARLDVRTAAAALERVAGAARAMRGESVAAGLRNELHFTRTEPYGVVALIVPFNHPTYFALHALAGVATGNAVVLKPSDQSPLSAIRLAELFADILPPGVFNVVTGTGEPTGRTLVTHGDVDLVYFVGSSPVGRTILQQAATGRVRATVVELGGKNPMVVCADADIDQVADAATEGLALTKSQGQSCSSTTRLLIERPIYDRLVDAVADRFGRIELGDPLDDATQMGPVVSRKQQARILGYIDEAKQAGGRVVTGGGSPSAGPLAHGAYVEPTLIADVPPDAVIALEEVFGPVLVALPWSDDDEAVRIANSVSYGLTASVWTNDLARAQRFVADIDAAQIFVNSRVRFSEGLNVDTWKDSGLGLTGDWATALTNFTHTKGVHFA